MGAPRFERPWFHLLGPTLPASQEVDELVDKRGVAELKVQMPRPFSVSAVGWRTPSSHCQHSRRRVNWSNEGSASPEAVLPPGTRPSPASQGCGARTGGVPRPAGSCAAFVPRGSVSQFRQKATTLASSVFFNKRIPRPSRTRLTRRSGGPNGGTTGRRCGEKCQNAQVDFTPTRSSPLDATREQGAPPRLRPVAARSASPCRVPARPPPWK